LQAKTRHQTGDFVSKSSNNEAEEMAILHTLDNAWFEKMSLRIV